MKTRKILSVLLVAVMLIGLMPAFTVSFAASVDDLTFMLNEDGESYYVLSCNYDVSGELIIPSTYNGKPITRIGGGAFCGCTALTSITIPNSVTSIEGAAFDGCTGLTSITIPNSVTSIGGYAFGNCTSLTSVTIPNSVTSVGQDAFSGTPWYNNLPNGLIYLGKVAYIYKGIMPVNTSIVIAKETESISAYAFCDCTGLTSITIPDSVTSIGENALSGTAWYNNQPDGLIYEGKVAYKYKGTVPNYTSIVLKEGTKSITAYAFYGCEGLTSITIPDSVTSIGDFSFCGCTGLTSVTIGSSVTCIDYYTFMDCTSLTSITIPDSVTSIKLHAFFNCNSLTRINIPDSVTSIDNGAFIGCCRLTIYCKSGSCAERYAANIGIYFIITKSIASDSLTVSKGVISGLKCGDSVGATLEKLDSSDNVKVFGLDGNEITDTAAKLGTGMVLKLYDDDGEVLDKVTVSVAGDLDGNGEVTTDDARNVLRATVGLDTPNNAQRLAADVVATSGDESITTDDARFILRVTVGLETL